MRYSVDFLEGDISNRLIAMLQACDANTIADLKKNGFLRLSRYDYTITCKSLISEHLAEYAAATGYSIHDIFYGIGSPIQTAYSENDELVLFFLNSLNEAQLHNLLHFLKTAYPNQLFYVGRDLRPSRKFRELLLRLPRGALRFKGNSFFDVPDSSKLSDLTKNEFQRYASVHSSIRLVFKTDCWPELADYIGVSLHWIWNMKGPLYCNKQIGDEVFDYYTLMQPEEKTAFVDFMKYYVQEQQSMVTKFLQKAGGGEHG